MREGSGGLQGSIALVAVVVLTAAAIALAWPRGATAPIGFPCMPVPAATVHDVLALPDETTLSSDNAAGRTSLDGVPVATVTCERAVDAHRLADPAAPAEAPHVQVDPTQGETRVSLVRDGVEVTIEVARPLEDADARRLAADWSRLVSEADTGRPAPALFVTAFLLPLVFIAAGRLAGELVERDAAELSTPLRLLVAIGSLEVGLGGGLARMARLLPDSWSDHPDQRYPRHPDRWPPD